MKSAYIFLLIFLILSPMCLASDIELFKNKTYNIELESKSVKANSSIVETIDIDALDKKIPDQIFTTVESGDWISSLPSNVSVSDKDNNVDKVTEYWEVSFAKVKNGRVIFSRIITNNDSIDRDSYAWDLKLKCRYVKYR